MLVLQAAVLSFYSKAEIIYLRNSDITLLPYWDCIILLLTLLFRVVLIWGAYLTPWILRLRSQQLVPGLFVIVHSSFKQQMMCQ